MSYAFAYDVRVADYLPGGDNQVFVKMYCLDRNSNPVLIRIEDFICFCYIELPSVVEGKIIKWTGDKVGYIKSYLDSALGRESHQPEVDFVKKYTLYYYQKDKKPFLFLRFNCMNAMRHCCNLLKKPRNIEGIGNIKLNTWEQDIDVHRKLFTILGLEYTQWFEFEGEEIAFGDDRRISKAGRPDRPRREFIVSWERIIPVSREISQDWIVDFKILSFDFETYSHRTNTFPDCYSAEDCIFIAAITGKFKDEEINTAIVLGNTSVENSIVVDTEEELLNTFEDWIDDYDPDIITGYNIFGFDNEYWQARRALITGELPKNISCLINGECNFQTKRWQSSGYGHTVNTILDCEGRIFVDMLALIKRDYKFDTYTLNNVSEKILDEKKHDVSAKYMFEAFEENQKNPKKTRKFDKVVRYAIQDTKLPLKLMIQLFALEGLIELSSVVGTLIVELFTRGEQIRTLSIIYNLAYHQDYVLTKRDFPYINYSGAYVCTPSPGLYDDVMALDFGSLYPSIIRWINICWTTMRPNNSSSEDNPLYTTMIFNQKKGEKPKNEEFETNDLGFAGREEGDSEDSDDEDDVDKLNKPLYQVDTENIEDEFSMLKKDTFVINDPDTGNCNPREGYYHFEIGWVKSEVRRGLLPTMMDIVVGERTRVRDQQKELVKKLKTLTGGSEEYKLVYRQWMVLEKRQLALKRSANSGYGFMGAQKKGRLPLVEGSMCVTFIGQFCTKLCIRYVIEKYGAQIIYGDTDSIMIKINGITGDKVVPMGKLLSAEISQLFPSPMSLEFEKGMRMILFKKKKYAAYLMNSDGSFKIDPKTGALQLLVRGIVMARRDNCGEVRNLYSSLLTSTLDKKDILDSFTIIIEGLCNMMFGLIPPDQLSVTKTLNKDYKNNCPMKVFGEKLRREGKPVAPGERLAYVVVETEEDRMGKKTFLGEKMKLLEDFTNEDKIDIVYYLKSLFMNPIDQLFSVGYMKELEKWSGLSYTPKRGKTVPISTPIKMIIGMLKDDIKQNHSIEKSREEVLDLPIKIRDYLESCS